MPLVNPKRPEESPPEPQPETAETEEQIENEDQGDKKMDDDLVLSSEEKALITERRSLAARKEAERIESEKLPDVLSLSAAQLAALPKERQSLIWAHVGKILAGQE